MEKPKIVKIEYCEDLPKESSILLYRFFEKIVIDSLPDDPILKGIFLNGSLDEFKKERRE